MSLAARYFPGARLQDLRELTGFVVDACERAGASEEEAGDIRLAVEEACTNVLTHGYAGQSGELRLGVAAEGDAVVITIEDRAPPFDPAAAPAPDLLSDWDEREVGGLGWHLIRSVMDEVRHSPAEPEGNRLQLVKRLRALGTDPAEPSG